MANDEHLKILKQGADIWNQWRKDNPGISPDLCGAQLEGANLNNFDFQMSDLRGANMSSAELIKSNLTRARLLGANLYRSNLSKANLQWADLRAAIFTRANLSEADLSFGDLTLSELKEANLFSADLGAADLRGANLTNAEVNNANLAHTLFDRTTIVGLDLSSVKGLNKISHTGPSTIDIQTFNRSKGTIPDVFLRGVGVPESLIESIPRIASRGIYEFYSCFISYSTGVQNFADQLYADLQNNGVRCWFASEDIKGGFPLHEQIPEAIRLYDKLLLVLSENSMSSQWVKTEIYHARQDEIRMGKRKLFPIGLIDFEEIRKWEAFDADVGKDMAREIREYFIPDFSDWKNQDSYKEAFDRLLRDLQEED